MVSSGKDISMIALVSLSGGGRIAQWQSVGVTVLRT